MRRLGRGMPSSSCAEEMRSDPVLLVGEKYRPYETEEHLLSILSG